MRSLAKLLRRGVAIEEASFGDPTKQWFSMLFNSLSELRLACNS